MNTIKILWLSVFVALCVIAFQACRKYSEGPAFSLLTKKARLCGTWQMDKYLVNGIDQTTFFKTVLAGYQIEIKKDETYKSSIINGTIEEGKWEFLSNKEQVKTTVNSTGEFVIHDILRLKNKELWLKQTENNGDVIELRLKAK